MECILNPPVSISKDWDFQNESNMNVDIKKKKSVLKTQYMNCNTLRLNEASQFKLISNEGQDRTKVSSTDLYGEVGEFDLINKPISRC
jgi:hypothetical protein